MKLSIVMLIVAVAVVLFAWMQALAFAAAKEFPHNGPKQKSILVKAGLLFGALVLLDLAAGMSGIFSRFDRFPPPFALFFVFNVIFVPVFIAFSQFGTLLARHISERALVGFQSFRILPELLIFAAVHENLAPVQMSFEGYNPDVLTALFSASAFFWLRKRSAPRLALSVNVFGVAALTVIGFIAITSMPGPLRLFLDEPSNIWVTTAPYTLLPGILVSGALSAHIIYFRKRAMRNRGHLENEKEK